MYEVQRFSGLELKFGEDSINGTSQCQYRTQNKSRPTLVVAFYGNCCHQLIFQFVIGVDNVPNGVAFDGDESAF